MSNGALGGPALGRSPHLSFQWRPRAETPTRSGTASLVAADAISKQCEPMTSQQHWLIMNQQRLLNFIHVNGY